VTTYLAAWRNVERVARASGAKYPELVAAQWALESNFGRHLGGTHNYFGLKGKGSEYATTEEVNGIMIPRKASFMNFRSLEECVAYLVKLWYKDYKVYKGVNNWPDRNAAAKELQHAGYATDTKYAEKLIKLMNEYSPTSATVSGIPELISPEKFQDIFENFKGEPHQVSSVWKFYAYLKQNCPHSLQATSDWFQTFRGENQSAGGCNVIPIRQKPGVTNPLSPWTHFNQRDNGPDGWRECQTSAIAMCLKYLRVGGINDDIDYLKIVNKYGDTTVQATHHKALAELGVKARFELNMTTALGKAEIDKGFPFAPGFLHNGPVTQPRGGGHYAAVYGYTQNSWIVSDPEGELDLVNGGFLKRGANSGGGVHYSFHNFGRRWKYHDGTLAAWIFS
jgi:hypothetical protein